MTTANPAAIVQAYLEPAPAPAGMTSREIVRRAIEFADPPRIPYSLVEPLESDFFETGFLRLLGPEAMGYQAQPPKPGLGEVYHDAWGVGWRVSGRTWDQAIEHPLRDLRELDRYQFPDEAAPQRFTWMAPYIQRAIENGKYVVGRDPIMLFEKLRALLGFEELMVAPYTQPLGLAALLDRMADLVIAVMDQWGRLGVHGFMTWEDFGLQTTLQIKLKTFREFYKPRYARMVAAAHDRGMHYIWHNCGYIWEMIPDLIEIGVDVLQLDQPRIMGSEKLADAFGGKICFWNAVDIQWCTSSGIGHDELRAEVAEMARCFKSFHGGYMARQYPAPRDIDLSPEAHRTIYEAFMENGCRLPQ